MNNNFEPKENSNLQHLQLFLYLIPVLGFFPSLWTLYRQGRRAGEQGSRGAEESVDINSPLSTNPPAYLPSDQANREKLAVSRLSVTLAFSWLLGYLLLNVGAETSEFLNLRLLVLNSLLTSGYFLVSIWLMVRVASRRPVRLPGLTTLAERTLGKY